MSFLTKLFSRGKNIEEMKQRRDVAGLVGLLQSKKEDEVSAAAEALSKMGGVQGAKALLEMCVSADVGKRMRGAMYFMTIEDPAAEPFLIDVILMDRLPDTVKGAAVLPLGRIKSGAAVKPLIQMFSNTGTSNEQLRTSILMSLGDIGTEEAREFLFQKCSDGNSAIRSMAMTSLGRTGDNRVLGMIKEEWLKWMERARRSEFSEVFAPGYEMIRALTGIGGAEVDQFLRAQLERAPNAEVRKMLDDAINHKENIVVR